VIAIFVAARDHDPGTRLRLFARGTIVKTPKDFWPLFHLAYARFEASGRSHQERLDAVVASYAKMSGAARRDMFRELRAVVAALHDLEPLVLVEALTDHPDTVDA
jgi:hypothetical protein